MADEKRKCDNIFIFVQNEPLHFMELSKLITHWYISFPQNEPLHFAELNEPVKLYI